MTRATFVIFFTEVIKIYWLMLLLYPDELYRLLGASSFSLYICNVHIKTTFIRSHWKPFFHFILFETELHNVYWFGNFNDVFWRIVPFITVQKNTKKNNQNWNQLLHRRLGIHVKQILSCPDISDNKYCHVQILVAKTFK